MTKASDNLFPKVILNEAATDGSDFSNPAADYRVLFLGEDGALHLKDSAGNVTDVTSGGAGLTFTAVTRELVFNAETTTSTIARTLTPAIAAVPSDAVLATGYIQISVNGTATSGNNMILHHADVDADIAAILYNQAPSGVGQAIPFACKVVQSSGSKLYYTVTRSANTVTYTLAVTGYWAPA